MSKLDRYDLKDDHYLGSQLVKDEFGDWVSYDDAKKLEQENDKLSTKHQNLIEEFDKLAKKSTRAKQELTNLQEKRSRQKQENIELKVENAKLKEAFQKLAGLNKHELNMIISEIFCEVDQIQKHVKRWEELKAYVKAEKDNADAKAFVKDYECFVDMEDKMQELKADQ